MNLRLIIDQSHEEFLTVANTNVFQALVAEMQFIIFPLIDRPITFEKIKDDDIFLIGCPSTPFKNSEISAIGEFVESGKFLILLSGSGGDYANNTNLSEISRRFDFEFNPDYVEDQRHYLNFSRIPIIQKFTKKLGMTKRIKKLAYSGCSISILKPTITPLLLTDSDSIPMDSPIMIVSDNHQVFGIGGYSIFSDDPAFGIKTLDNIRLVYNLFEYIKLRFGKDRAVLEKIPSTKPKRITLKSVKKQFIKFISTNIQKMHDLAKEIDIYWKECSDLIKEHLYEQTERRISSNYQQILQTINALAKEIGDTFSEYDDIFPGFKEHILHSYNQWYETEAEIRAKLDMIRNNLTTILDQEQLQA
ncbi:MAG: hypothetical protein HWN66_09265 [Candidatus Helarchaeota archaeon]|nr:hypothetical protein [Candidatus Helarchaeota archaeon]